MKFLFDLDLALCVLQGLWERKRKRKRKESKKSVACEERAIAHYADEQYTDYTDILGH